MNGVKSVDIKICCILFLLAVAPIILSLAQDPLPTPIISMSQFLPYSVINKDAVIFACSFTYTWDIHNSLSSIQLIFKYAPSTTIATFNWGSSLDQSAFSFSISSAYSKRVFGQRVMDTGPFKNYSITLSTYSPQDSGSYFCQLCDSIGNLTSSLNSVVLEAYCI